jgi:hypothetical protein
MNAVNRAEWRPLAGDQSSAQPGPMVGSLKQKTFSAFDPLCFQLFLDYLALAIHCNALHAYFANFAAREKYELRS